MHTTMADSRLFSFHSTAMQSDAAPGALTSANGAHRARHQSHSYIWHHLVMSPRIQWRANGEIIDHKMDLLLLLFLQ